MLSDMLYILMSTTYSSNFGLSYILFFKTPNKALTQHPKLNNIEILLSVRVRNPGSG